MEEGRPGRPWHEGGSSARIRLADLPYLHFSSMPEAVHLGDLLRIWVQPSTRLTPAPPDFQEPAAGTRMLYKAWAPLSRGTKREKRTLPGPPVASPGLVALPHWTTRGAHLRHSGFGDLNQTPFYFF